jgi:hypothetical protein
MNQGWGPDVGCTAHPERRGHTAKIVNILLQVDGRLLCHVDPGDEHLPIVRDEITDLVEHYDACAAQQMRAGNHGRSD